MGEFITTRKLKELVDSAPEGMDAKVLTRSLLDRGHEIEGLNSSFSGLEAVKNVPDSLLEFGKNIASALVSPLKTINALSSMAKGGIRSALEGVNIDLPEGDVATNLAKQIPEGTPFREQLEGALQASPLGGLGFGDEKDEVVFGSIVEAMTDRYGSGERALETIERDPVGFLADVSAVMTGGSTLGAKVAATSQRTGGLARVLEGTAKAGRAADPVNIAGAIGGQAAKQIRRVNELTGFNKTMREFAARQMSDVIDLTRDKGARLAEDLGMTSNPSSFLNKHNVSGTPEQMLSQLTEIWQTSKAVVDERLSKVPGTFKHADAQVILTELSEVLGKQDNLSQASLANFEKLQDLATKHANEGLTLVEMNDLKRTVSNADIINIFKQSSGVKEGLKAKEIGNALKSVKRLVEDEASKAKIPRIRELNRETQRGKALADIVERRIRAGRRKSTWTDRISGMLIYGVGATGASVTGTIAPLLGASAIATGLHWLRNPKVKSYMANRVLYMADGDFQLLQSFLETGKVTPQIQRILNREKSLLRKAVPELRLAGAAQRTAEKENNK